MPTDLHFLLFFKLFGEFQARNVRFGGYHVPGEYDESVSSNKMIFRLRIFFGILKKNYSKHMAERRKRD
jgi:hypothetical protein